MDWTSVLNILAAVIFFGAGAVFVICGFAVRYASVRRSHRAMRMAVGAVLVMGMMLIWTNKGVIERASSPTVYAASVCNN